MKTICEMFCSRLHPERKRIKTFGHGLGIYNPEVVVIVNLVEWGHIPGRHCSVFTWIVYPVRMASVWLGQGSLYRRWCSGLWFVRWTQLPAIVNTDRWKRPIRRRETKYNKWGHIKRSNHTNGCSYWGGYLSPACFFCL